MDRYAIRPDAEGWSVCDRAGVTSIAQARTVVSGLRVEDADELAYELSHDPIAMDRPHGQPAEAGAFAIGRSLDEVLAWFGRPVG